jgi:transcriptional regulator with XRE-family HTH domain
VTQTQLAGGQRDPALHSRILRQRLRSERARAGLTQGEVGRRLDWSTAKVLRIEGGTVRTSSEDVRALLEVYGVTDQQAVAGWIRLTRAARRPSWADGLTDVVSPAVVEHAGCQLGAATIRQAHTRMVPELAQTPRYAHAIHTAWADTRDTPAVHHWRAAARHRHLARLWGAARPAMSWILDESVLHRPVGGPDVLTEQLQHLRRLADQPQVCLRTLPYALGATPASADPSSSWPSITRCSDRCWRSPVRMANRS